MQVSENSDELYDELTNKIEAGDDPAARRVFQELLKTGRSRQEVVIQVSRMIEERRREPTVRLEDVEAELFADQA